MKILLVSLLMVMSLGVYSQNDSTSVFYMPQLKIYQKEKGKEVSYFFENDYTRFDVTPTRLIADTAKYIYSVELQNIRKMSFRYGSNFGKAAFVSGAVGFGMGFLLGGFFSLDPRPKFHLAPALLGGCIIALPFALIGGIVGALLPAYDDYEVNKVSSEQKRTYIMRLLKKYGRMKK